MMDNATHHLHHPQVVQLNNASPPNGNVTLQQQQNLGKSLAEPDHFLTIRLLMQGKVSSLLKDDASVSNQSGLGSWQYHWKTRW